MFPAVARDKVSRRQIWYNRIQSEEPDWITMTDTDAKREENRPAAPANCPDEERILGDSVRQIITARERTPRNPRWSAAWWRTMTRFNSRLAALRQVQDQSAQQPESLPSDGPNAGES